MALQGVGGLEGQLGRFDNVLRLLVGCFQPLKAGYTTLGRNVRNRADTIAIGVVPPPLPLCAWTWS
jgi:hypothetical protein